MDDIDVNFLLLFIFLFCLIPKKGQRSDIILKYLYFGIWNLSTMLGSVPVTTFKLLISALRPLFTQIILNWKKYCSLMSHQNLWICTFHILTKDFLPLQSMMMHLRKVLLTALRNTRPVQMPKKHANLMLKYLNSSVGSNLATLVLTHSLVFFSNWIRYALCVLESVQGKTRKDSIRGLSDSNFQENKYSFFSRFF